MGFGQTIRVQLPSLEGDFGKPVCCLQPNSKQPVSFRAAGNFELDCADCFHYIEILQQKHTMSTELTQKDCKAELRKKMWGAVFSSHSSFPASYGGAPIKTLNLYVQPQQTKAALKGGVSTQIF